MIDIEEIIAEDNRLLNQLIPVFVGSAEEHMPNDKSKLPIVAHALTIAAVEIARKGDLSPLDVLANPFNSAIYAIRENVEFIKEEADVFEGIDKMLRN
ncbi:MAG: hypothetical protein CMM15_10085 [Rhodospirillaceae bacterium]|nr:hypothetical protein [Rhodospirillaceae bacterium]OUU21939.1 MAG: hypothetical protein CBB97_15730 [Candidatus Endolissoclinum sp. TMED37]